MTDRPVTASASAPTIPGARTRAARTVRSALRTRVFVLVRGHRIWQVVADATFVSFAWWLAFFVRFDNGTPAFYERAMFSTIGYVALINVALFVGSGMYAKMWRYTSVKDMEAVLVRVVLGWLSVVAYVNIFPPLDPPMQWVDIPRSVLVYDLGFAVAFLCGLRLLARSVFERPTLVGGAARNRDHGGARVLIAGAGSAGHMLIRESQRQSLGFVPVGLVDDDARKHDMRILGVPVLGRTDDVADHAIDAGATEVIIAMPSAPGSEVRRIVEKCRVAKVKVRILPSMSELMLGGEAGSLASQIREVRVEDVLGRDPIDVDLQRIAAYLTGQVVLVTGAGGSIGSELCRQIASMQPSKLVLVDHAEDNLFSIQQELLHERGFDDLAIELADVTDRARMRTVFERHTPKVVFHAAAYKHQPMLETMAAEAVRNNTIGTRVCAELAERVGVERFVLVSTDKAVEPTTVMGQAKALAEWVVQAFADRSFHTRFMAVRFGNVLGSSGSVIPIFRRQIERGGPVTLTDERMTRFFMTIPEAAQLIVQAGAMGEGGEVFVLDMGEPVKIVDLARNMIELSGLRPGIDIEIEVVGLRDGEKLHEELFAGDERPERTSHGKIFRGRSTFTLEADAFLEELESFERIVFDADQDAAHAKLVEIMQPRIDAGAHRGGDVPAPPV
ncbi:MAG: polysaccharide biosynthesis protein CapD [Thermoleophilia bacterium]|nr:polysaccharide biosynthesis protein CapD [Thermoleophilia bacterium]